MSLTASIKHLLRASAAAVLALGVLAVPAQAAATVVSGCGSSTVAPLAAKWMSGFNKQQSVYTVAYSNGLSNPLQSFGFAADGECAFGASDFTVVNLPGGLSAEQLGFTSGVLQLPWALSATDVVYHVPGIGEGIKLSASALVGILSGQILNWNSERIQDLNLAKRTTRVHGKKRTYYVDSPKLPHVPITTIYQSGYSGDTYSLARFLRIAAPSWWAASLPIASHPSGSWPWSTSRAAEISAPDAAALVADVTHTKYSIGYVANPLVFGLSSGIDVARLRNAAGNYEYPALGNITDAAKSGVTIPPQGGLFQYLITWPSAAYKTAYPVSDYGYGILPENPSGSENYEPAGDSAFVDWILSSGGGQKLGSELGFAPLPSNVVSYDSSALTALP